MNIAADLGRASVKQAVVGQVAGQVARNPGVLRQLLGFAMKHPKTTAALGGLTGVGGMAANEGLAAAGMPHLGGRPDAPLWSPKHHRLMTSPNSMGGVDAARNFITRPIQSARMMLGYDKDPLQPLDAMTNRNHGDIKITGFDPKTGKFTFSQAAGTGQLHYGIKKKIDALQRDLKPYQDLLGPEQLGLLSVEQKYLPPAIPSANPAGDAQGADGNKPYRPKPLNFNLPAVY